MDPTNSLTRFIHNIEDDYLKTAFTNIDIDSLKPEEVAEMLTDNTRLIKPFLEAIQKDPTCDFHWLFEQRQFLSELSKGLANRIKLKQSAAKTAQLKIIQESVNRILPPTIWPSDDLMPVRYCLSAEHLKEFEKRWPDVRILGLKEAQQAYATFMHTEQLPPCEEKVLSMLLDTAIQYLDEASPEDRPETFRKVHKALLNACIERLDLKTPKQALKTILLFSERDIDYCNEFTCKLLKREEVWREVETLKKEQLKPVRDTVLRHVIRSNRIASKSIIGKLLALNSKISEKNEDLSKLAEADFSKQWLIPTRDGKFIETVDKSDFMTRAWSKERMAPKLKEAVDILSTFVENNDLQIQDIVSVVQLISKLHTVARKLPGEEGAPLRGTLDKIDGAAKNKFVAVVQKPYSISEAANQLAKAKVEELNAIFHLLPDPRFDYIEDLFAKSKPQEVLPIIKHLGVIANSASEYAGMGRYFQSQLNSVYTSKMAMNYLHADQVDDFIDWIKEGSLYPDLWLRQFVIHQAKKMDQGKLVELLSRLQDNVIWIALRPPLLINTALLQVKKAFDEAYPGRLKDHYDHLRTYS